MCLFPHWHPCTWTNACSPRHFQLMPVLLYHAILLNLAYNLRTRCVHSFDFDSTNNVMLNDGIIRNPIWQSLMCVKYTKSGDNQVYLYCHKCGELRLHSSEKSSSYIHSQICVFLLDYINCHWQQEHCSSMP